MYALMIPLQETFAEYTARTAFERPLLSGVAYAQRVNSERKRFEKQHRVVLKTMEREASQVRDEYAPVTFMASPFRLLGSHHLGVVLTFPVCKFKLPPNPTTEELIKRQQGISFFHYVSAFCF
jgi:arabidopsis histidine kinase 2/3/4 (cytokinin receptor)